MIKIEEHFAWMLAMLRELCLSAELSHDAYEQSPEMSVWEENASHATNYCVCVFFFFPRPGRCRSFKTLATSDKLEAKACY